MRFGILVLTSLLVNACDVTPKPYTPPQLPSPENFNAESNKAIEEALRSTKDLFRSFQVCDEVQKQVPDSVVKRAMFVRGELELQDTEMLNCEGKKSLQRKIPIKNFEESLEISPPQLNAPVEQVRIENKRTCVDQDAILDRNGADPIVSAILLGHAHKLNSNGNLILKLTNSLMKPPFHSNGLNVRVGQNIIELIYFNRDKEEVGRQTVLVNVEIKTRAISGLRKVDTCTTRERSSR